MFHLRTLGRGPGSAPVAWWLGATAAAAFCLVGGAALGQTATGGDQTAANGPELQEVVVTGSLIQRADTNTPAPLQTITLGDIQNTGATDISDVLHQLTANGQGNLNQSFGGAFAAGASGIALRDMTVDATLVLMDGHRMADYPISDDGQRSFVDVANLPLAAIERIDVLKDGASAIYGSDAIAGVVNIILRKTFVGTQISADYGTSYNNDATTYHASALYGFGDLGADGHNTYVSIEWRHQDPLNLDRRPQYDDFDFLDEYGPAAGGTNAPGTVPGPFGSSMAVPLVGMVAPVIPGTPPTAGPVMNLSACKPPLGNPSYTAPGGGCGFDVSQYEQIQPETSNFNMLLRHTQVINDNWTGTFTAAWFESKAEQLNPPSSTVGFTPSISGAGVNSTSVSANPVLLPIGNVNNPYPANEAWLGYTFWDVGPTLITTDTNMYRLVLDFEGKLGGWTIDTSLGYMRGLTNLGYYNFVTFSGLDSVIAANDYYVGANASKNNSGIYQTLAPPETSLASTELEYVEVNINRQLFTLPGGPFAVAFGAGGRHDGQFDPGQPGTLSGNVMGEGTAFINGTETNENLHGEFVAPLAKGLELDAALRWDNYADVGSKTVPKIGLRWSPFSDYLTLRGTYQEGFRAPGPGERGNSGVTFFEDEGVDTARCPVTHLPTDCGSGTIAGVVAGNDNLKPETSKAYTFGIVIQPLHNVDVTGDYWVIKRTNEIIGGVGPPVIIRGPVQAAFPTVPGPELEILAPYENVGSDEPKGIDVTLNTNWPLLGGPLHLDVDGSYTHLISQVYCGFSGVPTLCADVAGTHGPTSISGDTGTPRDRTEASIDVGSHDWLAGLRMNYVSHMTDTDPITSVDYGEPADTCLQPWFPGCNIKSFTDFDLFSHWQITPTWLINFDILDVFNESAPLDPQAAYTTRNYDNAFEQAGAIGRFYQIGFTVKM